MTLLADRWPRWLKAAAQMGIAPEDFWRMSLKEWRSLMALQFHNNKMSKEVLDGLIKAVERQSGHG